MGYAHLEVSTADKARQKAHVEVADEDLEDPEDDNDEALVPQPDRRSPRKSTLVQAFQAGDADEDEPDLSQAPKPKKPMTKAAAEPKQTTLTQPQGAKRTLSLPDLGTAAGSMARSKMLAAGLKKKKKPSTQRRWWSCSPLLQDMLCRIVNPRIPRLGNSSFRLSFSGASSEDDDDTGPKAAVSIARSRILKASRVDARCIDSLFSLFACFFVTQRVV